MEGRNLLSCKTRKEKGKKKTETVQGKHEPSGNRPRPSNSCAEWWWVSSRLCRWREPKAQQHPDREHGSSSQRRPTNTHSNPAGNDTKVNLAARRSLGAWRIQRWSRGRKRKHGVGGGGRREVEGEEGKKNGMLCGAAIKVTGWRCERASERGWVTVALADGARNLGDFH